MGCAVIEAGGSVAIVSGPAFGRKFCRFCGARAIALCDWPKMRVENVAFKDLKVGQQVLAWRESKQPHTLVYLAVQQYEIHYATEWRGHVTQFEEKQPWRGLWVPRMGTCGAPCCLLHKRAVGPETDYCRRHWDSWKQVA